MHNLSRLTKHGIISALAIDQRPILTVMFENAGIHQPSKPIIESFKTIITEELTQYVSAILLDPYFGTPAMTKITSKCGLIVAIEDNTHGYENNDRIPKLSKIWTVAYAKNHHADAIKLLVYYDPDGEDSINHRKRKIVADIGQQCHKNDIPFFLELLTYDSTNSLTPTQFAKMRPHKILNTISDFNDSQFAVDVLKIEPPVNFQYVQGYATNEIIYSKTEAQKYFREQSQLITTPFVFLSGGISMSQFANLLSFAKESGSSFNGVLCGRATWADAVNIFVKHGEPALRQWAKTIGKVRLEQLNNAVLSNSTIF